MPAILCGDLNSPQYEDRDGTVQTFAQTRTGRLRPGRGERHDRAERMIITGPPGWRDAFRTLHGYEARDRSWKTGRHPGYRLDHILVSPAVTALACAYDHSAARGGPVRPLGDVGERRTGAGRRVIALGGQTAEHSSSSATRNDEPQPQAATTLGLLTWNPAPWRDST